MEDSNPSTSRWQDLAEEEWTRPTTKVRKVRDDVIKVKIWDVLEKEEFDFSSLLALDNTRLLEKYLWPGYSENASNYHVLLIALMVTVKRRENLPAWRVFTENPEAFSSLFHRILSMSVDTSLTAHLRTQILVFLITAFQSLDSPIVRKECAALVSISIWHHLHNEQARESVLEEHAQLRKAWRAAARRYDAADESSKARLDFERNWLFTMVMDFVNLLYNGSPTLGMVVYFERFMEFLIDLESQLPTRRYTNTLLRDINITALLRNSPPYNRSENGLLRDLVTLLCHFTDFPVNDYTGEQYIADEFDQRHCGKLAKLQRIAMKEFKDQLNVLALSNYGSIGKREDLEGHLRNLDDSALHKLAGALGLRTDYSASQVLVSREFLMDMIVLYHERQPSYQETIASLSTLPTETDLYNSLSLSNEHYDGHRPLAIPKLNLQYLTVGDFLWRSFVLCRSEAFFEIRKDLEETVKKIQPRHAQETNNVRFSGFSRMALPIPQPNITEVAKAKVGTNTPSYVRAEVVLDVSQLADNVRREWDALRPEDVIFLVAAQPIEGASNGTNGHSANAEKIKSGIRYVRAAQVVKILDDNGKTIREAVQDEDDEYHQRPRRRMVLVNVDSSAWVADEARRSAENLDIWESINMVVRRRGGENNFKPILESIKNLALAKIALPDWYRDVFLGFGDPSKANYHQLPNKLNSLDLRDTLIDWQHLIEALPGKVIEPDAHQESSFGPPYVLEMTSPAPSESRPAKRRKRDVQEAVPVSNEIAKVSTYKTPNNGPFPQDKPKRNRVRFTPAQVEAISSGTQPGLTVIVGPPGTGKTDVVTQIISNIYHNFPQQRTLLIAHSNQALNQLFQKITNLDIDRRHLLRLGHGEGDLETDVNYSKHGRVESFLENRAQYLTEVDRLAANLGAPGAHGNSCETAGYFKTVYVTPAWQNFWQTAEECSFDSEVLRSSFPFYQYFSSAPQPLFPDNATDDTLVDIIKGCERHIARIFTELEDIRPFEILRNPRDRANHLLIKEARVIAMTSTHAAVRRQEIAGLGFQFENVIMEEAAQITEIETFIPLVLQKPSDGESQLQRIVLCGDHYQNSPIVQNTAFRQYANLEQSLFLRLVRLGVLVINLDKQGRARHDIANLYRWRYKDLGDLPKVKEGSDYRRANPGFKYDYQFIDVQDYKGHGEVQPSPHFTQNLGEAEYAVAIYQYMRLLGYKASKISILTTYAGQRALIKDVLNHRCARNRLFGMPRIITTVDKYQGEQNDCKQNHDRIVQDADDFRCYSILGSYTACWLPP